MCATVRLGLYVSLKSVQRFLSRPVSPKDGKQNPLKEKKKQKGMARVGFEPTHFSSVHQETAKVPPKDALRLVRGDALPLGHLTDY